MTYRVLKTRGIIWKTVKLNYAQKPYPNHAHPVAKTSNKVGNLIIAIIVLTSPYFLKRKILGSESVMKANKMAVLRLDSSCLTSLNQPTHTL